MKYLNLVLIPGTKFDGYRGTWSGCAGNYYVGSTTDKFRYRWNNYKNYQGQAERGENHTQKYLHDHFLSEDRDGLMYNVEITLIDQADPSDTETTKEF